MKMDDDLMRNDELAESDPAPAWVMDFLRSEWPVSPGFQKACDLASRDAWQLARLRRQVELAGEWVPRPTPDYLRSLTAAARVSLDWVVAWAGLPADFRPGDVLASGWGRLARILGLECREASLSYRLWLARAAGLEPPLLLVSARPDVPGRPASLDDWDRGLARSFANCGSEILDALSAAEDAIRRAYIEHEPSEGAKP
jgi:hypothetical protein